MRADTALREQLVQQLGAVNRGRVVDERRGAYSDSDTEQEGTFVSGTESAFCFLGFFVVITSVMERSSRDYFMTLLHTENLTGSRSAAHRYPLRPNSRRVLQGWEPKR